MDPNFDQFTNQFDKVGRTLTVEERKQIARRKGLCEICGIVQTHSASGSSSGGFLAAVRRKHPITDDNAYMGVCIRCHRDQVPAGIAAAWEERNQIALRGSDNSAGGHIKGSKSEGNLPSTRTRSNATPTGQPARATTSPIRGPSPSRAAGTAKLRAAVNAQRATNALSPSTAGPSPSRDGEAARLRAAFKKQQRAAAASGPNSFRSPTFPSPRPETGPFSSIPGRANNYLSPPLTSSFRSHSGGTTSAHSSSGVTAEIDFVDVIMSDSPDVSLYLILEALRRLRTAIHGRQEDIAMPPLTDLIPKIRDIAGKYQTNAEVQAAVAGAVWSISALNYDDSSMGAKRGDDGVTPKELLLRTNMIRIVVDILRQNDWDKRSLVEDNGQHKEWALGAMTSLSSGNDSSLKSAIPKAGGIEAVLDVLKKESHRPTIVEWSCRCLFNLVLASEENSTGDAIEDDAMKNISTIIEIGGIKTILGASGASLSNELEATSWVLRLMLRLIGSYPVDSSVDRLVHKQLGECDMASGMTRLLKSRSTTSEQFVLIVEIINVAMRCGQRTCDVTAAAARRVVEVTASVLRLMNEAGDDQNVIKPVCCLLSLAFVCCDDDDALRESGALDALLEATARVTDDLSILETSAWIIWDMSSKEDMLDIIQSKKAVKFVGKIAEDHHDTTRNLTMCTCGLWSNLQDCDLSDIHVTFLVSSTNKFSDDAEVGCLAVKAIARLRLSHPDLLERSRMKLDTTGFVNLYKKSPQEARNDFAIVLDALINTASESEIGVLLREGILDVLATELQRSTAVDFLEVVVEVVGRLKTGDSKISASTEAIFRAMEELLGRSQLSAVFHERCLTAMWNLSLAVDSLDIPDGLLEMLLRYAKDQSNGADIHLGVSRLLWIFAQNPQGTYMQQAMFRAAVIILKKYHAASASYEAEIMRYTTATLASVTANFEDNVVLADIDSVGTIEESVYKVLECESSGAEPIAALLQALLNLSKVASDVVFESGVLVLIVDTLGERPHSEIICEVGCRILCYLTSKFGALVSAVVMECDGIDVFCEALSIFRDNEQVQAAVCAAIACVSSLDAARAPIRSRDGIKLLSDALRTFSDEEEISVHAISALDALTNGETNSSALATEPGLVDALLKSMEAYSSSSPAIQYKCLVMLRRLPLERLSGEKRSDCLAALSRSMNQMVGVEEGMEAAFAIFGRLCLLETCQPQDSRLRGAADPIVNGILSLIDAVGVQELGLLCVIALSKLSEQYRVQLEEAGAVRSVFLVVKVHADLKAIQKLACQALDKLSAPVGSFQYRVEVLDDELNALCSTMRRFQESETVQRYACAALRNLVAFPSNAAVFRSHDKQVKALVREAAARFPESCSDNAGILVTCLE